MRLLIATLVLVLSTCATVRDDGTCCCRNSCASPNGMADVCVEAFSRLPADQCNSATWKCVADSRCER